MNWILISQHLHKSRPDNRLLLLGIRPTLPSVCPFRQRQWSLSHSSARWWTVRSDTTIYELVVANCSAAIFSKFKAASRYWHNNNVTQQPTLRLPLRIISLKGWMRILWYLTTCKWFWTCQKIVVINNTEPLKQWCVNLKIWPQNLSQGMVVFLSRQ